MSDCLPAECPVAKISQEEERGGGREKGGGKTPLVLAILKAQQTKQPVEGEKEEEGEGGGGYLTPFPSYCNTNSARGG